MEFCILRVVDVIATSPFISVTALFRISEQLAKGRVIMHQVVGFGVYWGYISVLRNGTN